LIITVTCPFLFLFLLFLFLFFPARTPDGTCVLGFE